MRVRVCSPAELRAGEVQTADLQKDKHGRPREALVVLDDGGTPRAYLNRCKHLPIPIDCGSRDFFDEDGKELICVTHGATYRLEDGLCTFGPCKGDKLEALELERGEDGLYVIDPLA